jgi:hypothetical protein
VAALLVLIVSQLLYAFAPYRRPRDYLLVLILTAAGFAAGQLWDFLGLPALRLGEANLIPALVFALLLQLLADRLPRPWRRRPG